MDYFDTWLRRLNPPRRNHFFTGKMMAVAQFEREQRYGMSQRWLLNRLTLGTGILCGLEVTKTDDGKQLRIEPGVAVDPWGREIIVARPVTYDPFKPGGGSACGEGPAISDDRDHLLCLRYRECTADDLPVEYADDCSNVPVCQPDTVVESFALTVSPATDAPAGFDCDGWTAPIESRPPTVDQLREHLIQQFGASRQAPADACVPLARITPVRTTNGGATWTISGVSNVARPQIVTQAQLLDLVLCLAGKVAECCHDDGQTVPPPGDASLRVNDLAIGELTGGDAVSEVVSLYQIAGPAPPRYVMPSSGGVMIAITFNRAIDARTLVFPAQPESSRSVSVHRQDPAGGVDTLVGLRAIVVALNPSVVLLQPFSNLAPTSSHLPSSGGTIDAGVYTLRLSGTADLPTVTEGRRLPIESKAQPPEMPLRLNGDYSGTLPSGDEIPGGDFVFTFELVPPLTVSVTVGDTSFFPPRSASWTWSDGGLTVRLDFSEDVDRSTQNGGIGITLTGTVMRSAPVFKDVGKNRVDVALSVEKPADPNQTSSIDFTLPKATLRAVDGRAFDHDVQFSIFII